MLSVPHQRKKGAPMSRVLGIVLMLAVSFGTAWAQDAAAAEPLTMPLWLNTLSRWIHIISAIVMLGGSIFMRFILAPSAGEKLNSEEYQRLKAGIMDRWRDWVMWLVLLFLVSGFYNYLFVTRLAHPGNPLYHILFGVKFLLAMGVFALAMILVSSRPRSPEFQKRVPMLQALMIALGILVVLVGGYMKMMK